jgi:hypothetical protein
MKLMRSIESRTFPPISLCICPMPHMDSQGPTSLQHLLLMSELSYITSLYWCYKICYLKHSCLCVCLSDMFITSKSLSDKAHVNLLREYFSIFEHILKCFLYFQRIFKEFICQVKLIGYVCVSIMCPYKTCLPSVRLLWQLWFKDGNDDFAFNSLAF